MADAATTLPSAPLKSSLEEGIMRLTLNTPERMNALSEAMMAALFAALTNAAKDNTVRVVVIDAVPGKVFCADHDLKEMTADANIFPKSRAAARS